MEKDKRRQDKKIAKEQQSDKTIAIELRDDEPIVNMISQPQQKEPLEYGVANTV